MIWDVPRVIFRTGNYSGAEPTPPIIRKILRETEFEPVRDNAPARTEQSSFK
jgi:hypothetical protein